MHWKPTRELYMKMLINCIEIMNFMVVTIAVPYITNVIVILKIIVNGPIFLQDYNKH